MPRWVDLRVRSEDQHAAMAAICDELSPVTLSVDTAVPGAVLISVRDEGELKLLRVLGAAGIEPVSSRTEVRADPGWVVEHASAS